MRTRNFLAILAFLFRVLHARGRDSAPKSAHADILNAQGTKIGTARITSTSGGGVKIALKVEQLPPGALGSISMRSESATHPISKRPAATSTPRMRTMALTIPKTRIRTPATYQISPSERTGRAAPPSWRKTSL